MLYKFVKSTALLFAAALMTIACLSGCGNTTGLDETTLQRTTPVPGSSSTDAPPPVSIKWLLRISPQRDGNEVLDEVNRLLKDKINANLDIQYIDPVAYPEKTKLMIAAGEEFDIMFTSASYGYSDFAAKGSYLPLNGLIEKYAPKTWQQIPADFWKATRISGRIYGIPNYQTVARVSTIGLRKDIAEKYYVNMSNYKALDQFEPVLEKMKAVEDKGKFIFAPPHLTYYDTMNYLGLEQLGAEGSPGAIVINGGKYKVINQFEYPSFVNLVKLIRSWTEKGYINMDLSLVKDPTELYRSGKILSSAIGNYKPGSEVEIKTRYGFEPAVAKLTSPYVNTTSVLGTLQAISRTSKNPEIALMFLDIVNTDKQVYNTIVYGLENKNYKKAGANRIGLIPNSGYATNVPWMIGNTLNAYLLPGAPDDMNEQVEKLNKTSKVSDIMGFSFDPEPVKAEIAQCLAVEDKYLVGLQYGMSDADSTLAALNNELKAAGMDKVIAEKQKQLDEWVAANRQQ